MTFDEFYALKPEIAKKYCGNLPTVEAQVLYGVCLGWEQFRVFSILDLGAAAGDYTIAHARIRDGSTFEAARAEYVAAFPNDPPPAPQIVFPEYRFPW